MTPLPTTWTDGYGTVHAGPPPTGYWIASDDRWYAPELHPDYAPTQTRPTPEAIPTDPDHERSAADHPMTAIDTAEPTSSIGAFDLVQPQEIAEDPSPSTQSSWRMPSLDDTPSYPPPDQPATAPETAPVPEDDAPPTSKRTLVTAIVGVVAVLGLAAAGYRLMQSDDTTSIISGDEASASTRTPSLPTEITAPTDGTADGSESSEPGEGDVPSSPTSVTTAGDVPGPGAVQPTASNEGDLEGIESCTRIDAETLEISMVNVTDATASYLLTVAYLDDTGTRVGDDNVYVSSLRPGERTIEQSYVFSDAGVGCDVIAADRYDRNGVEGLADISACTIREPNSYGFIEADLTATNSGPSDVDYTVEVALVGADNVRRGYGTAYIERTPVGATAAGEVYTTVEYDETLRCDVVAVTRFESTK